jgi:hypothetical protein
MANKTSKTNQENDVDRFMVRLEHPLKDVVEEVRRIILAADDEITEHIKWNAPSFGYHHQDRVTFRLYPKEGVQLIFHRGAKVKASEGFTFEDDSGLLQWLASDRAAVTLLDRRDVEAKEASLARVVKRWMDATR